MSSKPRKYIDIQFEDTTSTTSTTSKPSQPKVPVPFRSIALFPAVGDNCAVLTNKTDAGTLVELPAEGASEKIIFSLSHTVLEGHRICAVKEGIKKGEFLLSWGLPFGIALRDISLGEYVSNASLLSSIRERNLDFQLPDEPNFEDRLESVELDFATFKPGKPIEVIADSKLTFKGYKRSGGRGVGTRNFIVVLGLTSRTSSFARVLEQTLKTKVKLSQYPNIDGIVSVTHTEGGTKHTPLNNIAFVLRALCGWAVHPNIGAMLVVDDDVGLQYVPVEEQDKYLTRDTCLNFMKKNNYPLDHVKLDFLQSSGDFQANLAEGVKIVEGWLDYVNKYVREDVPLTNLKIALQCGGSDAFSGVSANPLIGRTAMELLKHGGAANLAETDELMGAEPYILRNARTVEVAKKFLDTVAWYKKYAGNHGHNAEGNPSGGNKFRGLYNIALKSLGAAMKKHSSVTLDHVVDYGERMLEPGYYFMNSPGNDLESIAGQTATGANVIFFTTGNGSITNFPFVPTIKVVTTTNRFKMLEKDMDFNAGEILEGVTVDELGLRLFDRLLDIASGTRSVGEKAGHSQVSIWRNWAFNDKEGLNKFGDRPELLSGDSLVVTKKEGEATPLSDVHFKGVVTNDGKIVTDQIGLVLPTSICSGQIARLITDKLNAWLDSKYVAEGGKVDHKGDLKFGVSKFVCLPHTEGCGSSGGAGEYMYRRTILGHLLNPVVKYGLLLEHGCEKTHNDYMSNYLREINVPLDKFGWASVQLDGGIDKVTEKVINYFTHKLDAKIDTPTKEVGLGSLKLALTTPPNIKVNNSLAKVFGTIVAAIVKAGGYVVIPQNSGFLQNIQFLVAVDSSTPISPPVTPTISYGQLPKKLEGLHVMQTMTDHWIENLTGIGATGAELVVSVVDQSEFKFAQKPQQTHPMITSLQITTRFHGKSDELGDFDVVLSEDSEVWEKEATGAIVKLASREFVSKLWQNSDFQIARDILAVSM